jgi:mono/diheme cytochrome c family protein/peroxiredoxin
MDDVKDILAPAPAPAVARRPSPLSVLGLVALAGAVLALSMTLAWGLRQTMGRGPSIPPPPVPAATAPASPGSARLLAGGLVYRVHCLRCHGAEGHGDGPDAAHLASPARDFASPSGWRHGATPKAIRKATVEGVPGTPMLPWGGSLSAPDLEAVVSYVHSLATPARTAPGPSLREAVEAAGLQPCEPARMAPDLAIEDLDGARHRLAEFRGKAVLLVFWGTTCAPCVSELPELERLHAELGGRGLSVLPVCVDETEGPAIRSAAKGLADRLPLYLDGRGDARLLYDVSSLPSAVLIDRQGLVLARGQGARSWSSPAIRALFQACLSD